MPRSFVAMSILALALAACQAPGATPARSAGPRPAPMAEETPGAHVYTPVPAPPRPTATAAATAAPTAAPAPLGALRPPPGASTTLSGVVRVDPAYIVAAGAGNVLSHNGGTIVAAGGLNLRADNLAGIVAAGGLNVVAAGAGNIVAAGGLNLRTDAGGSIVAAGAGNFGPSQAAGAPAGAPAGGPSYRLAQGAPAAGAQVPAAGMLVSVASLKTRRYLPLGKTTDGQDAYAVYSGPDGGYTVHVPPGDDENLLVIAQPPVGADARLVYNVLTPRTEAPRTIDEDAAIGTRYLRAAMIGRFKTMLVEDDPQKVIVYFLDTPEARAQRADILAQLCLYYRGIARSRGVGPTSDPKVIEAMAREVSDALLAATDLAAIEMSQAFAPKWKGADGVSAVKTLGEAMKILRERATAYMRDPADPDRYVPRIDAAFLAAVNEPTPYQTVLPGEAGPAPLLVPDRKILRPADVNDFVIEEYLSPVRNWVWQQITTLFVKLDPEDHGGRDASYAANQAIVDRMESATAVLGMTLAIQMLPGTSDPTQDPPASNKAASAAAAAAKAFSP